MNSIIQYVYDMLPFTMMYLVFAFVIISCLSIKDKKVSAIIITVLLVLVASVRINVGTDFYNYYIKFNTIHYSFNSYLEIINNGVDIGYNILNYFIQSIVDFEFAIFFVVSILIYPYTISFIRKNCIDFKLGIICYILLGFYLISLNIMKQSIAMTLILLFYSLLKDRKYIKSIIILFIASLMHTTALFVGLLIILSRFIKPSKVVLYLGVIIGFGISTFLEEIVYFFSKFLPFLNDYLYYFDESRSVLLGDRSISFMIYIMVIFGFFIIHYLFKYKDFIKEKSIFSYQDINLIIFAVIITVMSINFWPLNRLAFYFYQFLILLIPILLEKFNKDGKFVFKIILYLYMALFLIFNGENEYRDYDTIIGYDREVKTVEEVWDEN